MDQPVFLVQTMVFPFHTDGCYNEIKKSLEDNQQDHYLNQRHIFYAIGQEIICLWKLFSIFIQEVL